MKKVARDYTEYPLVPVTHGSAHRASPNRETLAGHRWLCHDVLAEQNLITLANN